MKTPIVVLAVLSVFTVVSSTPLDDQISNHVDITSYDDAKMHFFVLMVPETSVQKLRKARARQEEETAETVTETGVYVGQIISGVLGGDVRPIFAGSASFIDEPDVQQGVSTILANVAPSLNNILKQWVSRVQTALGITSTLRPGSVVLGNNTQQQAAGGGRPSNGVSIGRPITVSQASKLTPQQLLQQQQRLQQQQAQQIAQELQHIPQRLEGSGGNGNGNGYEYTTVEPLPLINFKPSGDGDDEQEETLGLHKKV